MSARGDVRARVPVSLAVTVVLVTALATAAAVALVFVNTIPQRQDDRYQISASAATTAPEADGAEYDRHNF